MASRNGSRRRGGWQGLTTTQFVFGMLAVVGCAVLADRVLIPAFKQPVKLSMPEAGASPGAFARSDGGDGVTFPIGTPNLLTTYETVPDLNAVHKIEGTNEELAAAAQPVRTDAQVVRPQAPARNKQARPSGGWLVDPERPVVLPPNWQSGYFSAPVGGFRGFPGGVGNGSVKSAASVRSDS